MNKEMPVPAGIHLSKVNNKNTRSMCKIYSKLTIKTQNDGDTGDFLQK